MKRIIAMAAAGAALTAPTTAPAVTRHWNVTAEVTGAYANDVTGTARCPARFRERLTGVRARFTSRSPLAYDTTVRVLTGGLRYTVTGRWSVAGSYVPLAGQADGTLECAGDPVPVACTGKVVADDGHRVRTSGTARLAVDDNTRGAVVSRLDGPRLTELYAAAGAAPAGWPSVCRVATDDETVPVAPLFGLASTGIADRRLAAPIPIPASRLAGRRRFTVRVAASPPRGCPADGFAPCSEQGGFATHMTFTAAGRR